MFCLISCRYRRGDHADRRRQLVRDDEEGDRNVAQSQERQPRLIQLQKRLLHGRDAGGPSPIDWRPGGLLFADGHPALHAHDASRLQKCQLHQAGPVRQVFPQPREGPRASQPLPAGLFGRGLHLLPGGAGPGSLAALPAGLRVSPEEVL